jgi:hypothetical protein
MNIRAVLSVSFRESFDQGAEAVRELSFPRE